ncbi:MAG: FtsW/RodA/SpoVE family cell cycle protein, partial [Candidatus Bathyarchaeia archaeon]
LVAGAVSGLVVLQKDLGTALVLFAVTVGLLWAVGLPARQMGTVFAGLMVVLIFFVATAPHRVSRMLNFLDPMADPERAGYQSIHSMMALATGGFWGVGLGGSRQKWGALPNAHTDFLMSVVGEELEISAEITEGSFGLGNVTLFYRTRAEADWISVRMDRRSGNIFSAKIPSSQIMGDVVYFISAEDNIGNVVKSPLAFAGLRSFELIGVRALARLYWDSGSEIRFGLVPINGFSSAVGFEVLGLPEGIVAEFEPAIAIPKGSEPVEVLLKLIPLGPSRPAPGEYRLLIRATHGAFSRELQARLLVPTFDLSLQPPSLKVPYGGIAKFNVSISRRYGFDRELRFEVRGLPSDIFETKLIVPEGVSLAQESKMVLEVYVSPYARIGTYDFKLIVTGGGIEREVSANLKVFRTRV